MSNVPLHLSPVGVAKAKLLGVLAASVTAGGVGGALAVSSVAPSSDPPTVAVVTAATSPIVSSSPSPTASPKASASPTYVLPSCSPGENHGKYVSSVAHTAPKGKDGEHGSSVSKAAHSTCGKPTPASSPSHESEGSTKHAQNSEHSHSGH